MSALKPPSKELARKILAEVGFHDRLIGYRLHHRIGPAPVTLYSFEEVVGFLTDASAQLDHRELTTWVREVISDPELAGEIKTIAEGNMNILEKTRRIGKLMGIRLIQCRRVV